jgi:hypothetical protein
MLMVYYFVKWSCNFQILYNWVCFLLESSQVCCVQEVLTSNDIRICVSGFYHALTEDAFACVTS